MNLPQLRVFTFAVIRGLMPLGVAQEQAFIDGAEDDDVIRGFMPLGVAQVRHRMQIKSRTAKLTGEVRLKA